jgi:ATP-dependent protease ClpP protease subunit
VTDPTQEEGDITLDRVVVQQVDESSRTIYFFESIDAPLLRRLIPTLNFLAEESDEPIYLECTSPGGADGVMFALADAIETLSVPVHLRAYGLLASAASILFAVCAERYVGRHCEMLLHGFLTDLDAGPYTARDLIDQLESVRLSARRWARIMSRVTHPDILPFDELLDIALGNTPERRLVGAELVSAGLANGLLSLPVDEST